MIIVPSIKFSILCCSLCVLSNITDLLLVMHSQLIFISGWSYAIFYFHQMLSIELLLACSFKKTGWLSNVIWEP